jgi:hypothetical protein
MGCSTSKVGEELPYLPRTNTARIDPSAGFSALARQRTSVMSAALALFGADEKGVITFANSTFYEFTMWTPSDVIVSFFKKHLARVR